MAGYRIFKKPDIRQDKLFTKLYILFRPYNYNFDSVMNLTSQGYSGNRRNSPTGIFFNDKIKFDVNKCLKQIKFPIFAIYICALYQYSYDQPYSYMFYPSRCTALMLSVNPQYAEYMLQKLNSF